MLDTGIRNGGRARVRRRDVTVEYTALDSPQYRHQVIESLDTSFTGFRAFSFRHEFADQWYDFNNPDQSPEPMTVRFETTHEDFPANVDALEIETVRLYFATEDTQIIEGMDVGLGSSMAGSPEGFSEASPNADGLISTGLNAAGWVPVTVGKRPVGHWALQLPNTPAVRALFDDEETESATIQDILFVITYSGQTAEWPE